MKQFTIQPSTKVKLMNWNQFKDGEKPFGSGLNQQLNKHTDANIDMIADENQETHKDGRSKADKKLSALNNILKNMIRTSKKAAMPIEMGLTGFYKEISKSIKRN
jgi:hypothetical protein